MKKCTAIIVLLASLAWPAWAQFDFHDPAMLAQGSEKFTFEIVYNASATAPKVVAPTLTDGDVTWTEPGGITTNTLTPLAWFFATSGTYTLDCTDWSAVTRLNFYQSSARDWLRNINPVFSLTTALERFYAYRNSGWSQDISGWILPDTMERFFVYSTAISIDLSQLDLPNSLKYLYIYDTSISGDISSVNLPSSLLSFYGYSTSLSGDVSQLNLPTSLGNLYLYSTSIDYGFGAALAGAKDNGSYKFQDCALSETEVDTILCDLDGSTAIDGELDVSGTDAAPSATGATCKANLVSKGWTVTTN